MTLRYHLVLVGWTISNALVEFNRYCPSDVGTFTYISVLSLFLHHSTQPTSYVRTCADLPVPSNTSLYQLLHDLTLLLVLAASASSSSLKQANIPTMMRIGEVAASTLAPAHKKSSVVSSSRLWLARLASTAMGNNRDVSTRNTGDFIVVCGIVQAAVFGRGRSREEVIVGLE